MEKTAGAFFQVKAFSGTLFCSVSFQSAKYISLQFGKMIKETIKAAQNIYDVFGLVTNRRVSNTAVNGI